MANLSKEQIAKKLFVENELIDVLISATGGFVTGCEYVADGPDEYVLVSHWWGSSERKTTVNVTADSRWAILKDVLKAVEARYT